MTKSEPARRSRNPLARFLVQLTQLSEAMEVTEVEVISERVARLEYEIVELRKQVQAMDPFLKWQAYSDSPEYRMIIGG